MNSNNVIYMDFKAASFEQMLDGAHERVRKACASKPNSDHAHEPLSTNNKFRMDNGAIYQPEPKNTK